MNTATEFFKFPLFRLIICSFLIFAFTGPVFGGKKLSSNDESLVRSVMKKQEEAWNSGNLEEFMKTYWKSEHVVFLGKNGPTYGWQKILDNYKMRYPDQDGMGKLKFNILEIAPISSRTVFLIGKYHLTRKIGDLEGFFSLVIKRIRGEWLIIADHS